MNIRTRNLLIINIFLLIIFLVLTTLYKADTPTSQSIAPYSNEGTGYLVNITDLESTIDDSDQRNTLTIAFNDFLAKYVTLPSESYKIDLKTLLYSPLDENNKKSTSFNVVDTSGKNTYTIVIEGSKDLWASATISNKTTADTYTYAVGFRAEPQFNSIN
jgi:hypothetical protein